MATAFKRAAADIKKVTENYRELNGVMQETVGIVRMGVSAAKGSGAGGGAGFGSAGGGARAHDQPSRPTLMAPSPITSIWNQRSNEMLTRMARAMETVANNTGGGGGGGGDTGTELRRQGLV